MQPNTLQKGTAVNGIATTVGSYNPSTDFKNAEAGSYEAGLYNNSLQSTPVPATPVAGDLAGTTPLNVPPTPTGSPAADALRAHADSLSTPPANAIVDAQGNATVPPPTGQTAEKSKISALIDKLSGQSADRTKMETDMGVSDLQKQSIDSYNKYRQLKNTLQQQELAAEQLNTGGRQAGRDVELAKMRRDNSITLANAQIDAQYNSDNYKGALDTIDRKIKAIYEPLTAEITARERFIELNQNDLSESEKIKLTSDLAIKKDELKAKQDATTEVSKTLMENGAPDSVRQAVDKESQNPKATPASIYAAAGEYGKDRLKESQIQENLAQAQKAIAESNGVNSLGDPSQLVAYGQQYASTGMIPTGLPKGTFGQVANFAKEMPKTPGTLVSRYTGITPPASELGTERKDSLISLYNAVSKADDLLTLDAKRNHGIISGALSKTFGSADASAYIQAKDLITKELQYALSGKAITQQEFDYFDGLLPSRVSNPFGVLGQNSQTQIENFKKSLTSTLTNKLEGYGASIYGFSKVKVGDQDYTVGDTITNARGTGRVNPDGSVTILEAAPGQVSMRDGKEIVAGYDITSYATDPNHGKAVSSIYQKIPQVASATDVDSYIKSIAPKSPVRGSDVIEASQTYGVDPKMVLAIMVQDSTLGTKGKAVRTMNPGNVGNTDDGSTRNYKDWRSGVLAVAKNLSNRKTA